MPIDWGPVMTNLGEVLAKVLLIASSKAGSGKKGPSIQEKAAEKYGAFIDDELIGKIGPIVGVYESETTSRMTGEW